MPFFRDIPIKRKLTIIIMVTSSVALLLACVAIVLFERAAFRESMAREFAIIADMFDDNVAPGLTFEDEESMDQTLQTLSADPHIMAACVYDKDGHIVAKYKRPDVAADFPYPKAGATGQHFQKDRLDTRKNITLAGEVIGWVYIGADLTDIDKRLRRSALVIAVVMAVAFLVAYLVSRKLQGVISSPISHLAQVVRVVARNKDYSVRAVKQSDDELGVLIDGFNEMLGQIEYQNTALESARDGLERRVGERTTELATSLSLLNATLDSTTDGILAIRYSGEIVCYNSRFAAIWGIPKERMETMDQKELQAFVAPQHKDPVEFVRRVCEIFANRESLAFDVLELKDGRTFERYVKPQLIDGENVGMVVTFRDITKRMQAEKELQNIHGQLLEASRKAGMAEVATSVLHNVGNVLNSVGVSAEIVSGKIRQPRAGALTSVAELLREHAADLPGFLAGDSRGRALPEYLLNLVEHLAEPPREVLRELDSLRKNIEHIKEIVAMQQNFATFGGVKEMIDVVHLVEDSMRMSEEALRRHRVEVIREFEEVSPINVEKHKILQILVNLLRNAKHACQDSDREDKRLTVRVARGDGRITIAVIDNGIGIPPENLTRIFNHGFTTRKEGHGFGLHSGALAAKELGGALSVHSDGPGRGATFILELPCENPASERGDN